MRISNTTRSLALIVCVGIMPVIGLNVAMARNTTAWERQGQQANGRPYTIDLASDGCFWRTYMTDAGRHRQRHVDILPDAQGGHENCPYRS